jgi:hypothetical protein
LAGITLTKNGVRAANMAQRRPEKRPQVPDFIQTKGEPRAETGLCLVRIFAVIFA